MSITNNHNDVTGPVKSPISGHLALVSIVFFLLLARMLWFVDQYSVNVLFWDQWDYLTLLFNENNNLRDNFLIQHGPHRQGLGGVWAAIVYPLVNWNIRVDAFVSVLLIAVATLVVLVTKLRVVGRLHWADSAIPAAFFTLLQYEILIGTVNLAHGTIPLLLVALTALALTINNERLRATCLVALLFLTTYTGFAIFSSLVVILILSLLAYKATNVSAKAWNAGALALSLMIVASFFIDYQSSPAADCFQFPHDEPLYYLIFSIIQFGSAWGHPPIGRESTLTPAAIAYSLAIFTAFSVTVGLAFARVLQRKHQAELVIFYLASFSLLFIAVTAIGRTCTGLGGAFSSRYITYSLPAMIAIYLGTQLILTRHSVSGKTRSILLACMVSVFLVKDVSIVYRIDSIDQISSGKQDWIDCYLEQASVHQCNVETDFQPHPSTGMVARRLVFLEENNLSFFR